VYLVTHILLPNARLLSNNFTISDLAFECTYPTGTSLPVAKEREKHAMGGGRFGEIFDRHWAGYAGTDSERVGFGKR
jgi:hypothetical protein